jgi:hypothetical protein
MSMNLKKLFVSHANDLQSVYPAIGDTYVCPICLRKFLFQEISTHLDSEELSVGDVWPKYFRSRSEKARKQRVLLCKRCNSKAGYHGDYMMQIIAQLSEEKRTGKTYAPRRIRVTSGWQEIANLKAFVEQIGEKEVRLSFPKYKKESQQLHFGKELQKFREYAAQELVNITVYPLGGGRPDNPFGDLINWPLAQVGLLTSAYLLAFYTFGYRYILSSELDLTRRILIESFQGENSTLLESEVPRVWECDTHYCNDPEIGLVAPVEDDAPTLLQISILSFHVNLPFPQVPRQLFEMMLEARNKSYSRESPLYISIECSKMDGHDCMWDYILGKPIPAL